MGDNSCNGNIYQFQQLIIIKEREGERGIEKYRERGKRESMLIYYEINLFFRR